MTKDDFLAHHGILGMKWGVRRYQNEDGTLTAAGKARYKKVYNDPKLKARDEKEARKAAQSIVDSNRRMANERISAAIYFSGRDNDKAAALVSAAKAETLIADRFEKKIAAIDAGDLQAGRDFIVQYDYNLTLGGLKRELNIFEQRVDQDVTNTKDLVTRA